MRPDHTGGRATRNAPIADECGHRRFIIAGRQGWREDRLFALAGHRGGSCSSHFHITVPLAYSAQFRILPRFFPRIAGRNVVPPCRRFLPAGLLRELVAASRDQPAERFRFVRMEFPGASLLGRFASLIGRFISLFARLGNSSATARRFNNLRVFWVASRAARSFASIFPWTREIAGRGDSRRAPVVPGAQAVRAIGCWPPRQMCCIVARATRQLREEDRVTAILSLGRRSCD